MAEIHELDSPAVAKAPPLAAPRRSAAPGSGPGRPKRGWLSWAILAVAVVAVVWYFETRPASSSARAGAGGFPVPIVSGTVRVQDVPVYLDGIGTVQAFNTVTVHSRVDGQLNKIAFTEGQDVKAGDTLAIIDPAPFQTALDQAIGKRLTDSAQLANANLDMQRDEALYARKVIDSQDYDTQKALVAQLNATVAADEAAVGSAQVQLGYTTIASPLAGRVGIRQIDQGNIVHAADVNGLVVITQLQPISVIFTLPEQNLEQIHQQTPDPAGLPVVAVDRDNSTVLDSGTLAVIDNQIDTTTGTIRIRANFPNARYQLWPGGFVNARLLLTTRKNGIVVPASVVQQGPDGAYAYVVTPQQTAEIRKIKVGQIDNNTALIDSGLTPGEIVVVDGQYKLQDGSKVKTGSAGGGAGAHAAGSPGSSPGASPGHRHHAADAPAS